MIFISGRYSLDFDFNDRIAHEMVPESNGNEDEKKKKFHCSATSWLRSRNKRISNIWVGSEECVYHPL